MDLYAVFCAKLKQIRLYIFYIFHVYTVDVYKQGDKSI